MKWDGEVWRLVTVTKIAIVMQQKAAVETNLDSRPAICLYAGNKIIACFRLELVTIKIFVSYVHILNLELINC